MVTYIYFVKCHNCEDEPFDFFDEAKGYAMGCLSQKPIITQTEVCRNDFGECTDSADLGTVWSWEDIVGKETDAEPATAIFTKDDFKDFEGDYNPENDPEFDVIDNSVDFEPETSEISAVDEVPDNFRKPVPADMTIDQLKEAMEENEDTVECAGCEELFPKEECFHKEGIGYLCGDCEDRIVRCTWCEDLFDRYECDFEANMGWLCDRCQSAITSRGERLTLITNPTEEDFARVMTEEIENNTLSFEDLVKDSINHLVNDLGKDPWADDFADDVIKDIEDNYDIEVPEDMSKYKDWYSSVASEVSRQVNTQDNLIEGFSWIKAGDRFTLATDNGDEHYVVRSTYDKEDEKHLDKYERFIQVAKETPDGTFENPIDIEYVVLADYKNRGKLMFESKSFLVDTDKEVEPNSIHDLGNEYDGGYPENAFDLDFPEV